MTEIHICLFIVVFIPIDNKIRNIDRYMYFEQYPCSLYIL